VAATTSFEVLVPTPTDPTYFGYIPEEVAQFYMNFQSKWTLDGKPLQQALREAAQTAQGAGVPVVDPPWQCLTAFGYLDLTHNQYNWGPSWAN